MALSRRDHIRALAELIATDFFICMLNPTYRGAQFDYHTFDIGRHVQAMIGTSFPKPLTDKEREAAGVHAMMIWDRWVKQAGDGLPRPQPLPASVA